MLTCRGPKKNNNVTFVVPRFTPVLPENEHVPFFKGPFQKGHESSSNGLIFNKHEGVCTMSFWSTKLARYGSHWGKSEKTSKVCRGGGSDVLVEALLGIRHLQNEGNKTIQQRIE